MDGKDWLLVLAGLVIFGGPLGHAIWRRSKGNIHKSATGETLIDDPRRIGAAVTSFGGRTLAEGAKLRKFGALRYNGQQDGNANQQVGGA